jgi:GT2 family glycosyltransferase
MLGVIVINYNNYEKTFNCMDSLIIALQGIESIIYLLDNASSNNSLQKLSERYGVFSQVQIVHSKENLGYARGNNLCLYMAEQDNCEQVLISNNDIIYEANTVQILLNTLLENQDLLLVGPRLYKPDGSYQLSVKYTRPKFGYYFLHDTYLSNFVNKEKCEILNRYKNTQEFQKVYWLSGACFLADLRKFKQIGFFDMYTFLYYEEFILSEKSRDAGFSIGFQPQAEVMHYHGASTGAGKNIITKKQNFRSEIYFFKNYWNLNWVGRLMLWLMRNAEVKFTFGKLGRKADVQEYRKYTWDILIGKER